MTMHEFKLQQVSQVFENGHKLATLLHRNEIRCYEQNDRLIQLRLMVMAKMAIQCSNTHGGTASLYQHHYAGPMKVRTLNINISAPEKDKQIMGWPNKLPVTFYAVIWPHDSMWAAYVPQLDLYVLTNSEKQLENRIRGDIRFLLDRKQLTHSIPNLITLNRTQSVEIRDYTVKANILSPRQLEQTEQEKIEKEQTGILNTLCTDLKAIILQPAFQMDDVVLRMADALSAERPTSILLVGPAGVGKTATFHELIRQRDILQMGMTPFFATTGSRITANQSKYGNWQSACKTLFDVCNRKRVVLHLGNLADLLDCGKCIGNEQGMTAFLKPYLARRELTVVVECTPDQLSLIEEATPNLLDLCTRIDITEPNPEKGRQTLQSVKSVLETEHKISMPDEALATLDFLHRRYAVYSVYPGRPLRFMRNLFRDHEKEMPITSSAVIQAFSSETGLPTFMLNDDILLDLEECRKWFESRVMGQPEAIEMLLNILATIKTRLVRPEKPMASMLFIGPTGVGKTEAAKALARFLFGSSDRMIRIDMSEYSDALSVRRLVGGNMNKEGILTSKIREKPFSVLLLDEFEKAHPDAFDLLLQVLGEGRLTDAAGRTADFRNSIIIMTSNLGARTFKQVAPGFGELNLAQHAREHFLKEVRKFLRPEMFNRLDMLVPFLPLKRETIRCIAEKEIAKILTRDGFRHHQSSLEIPPTVIDHLASNGYDPLYGARPLKRYMEQHLLVPVSEMLNQHPASRSLQLTADVSGDCLDIQRHITRTTSNRTQSRDRKLVDDIMKLRRSMTLFQDSPLTLNISNRLTMLHRNMSGYTRQDPFVKEAAKITTLLDRIRQTAVMIYTLEQDILKAYYSDNALEKMDIEPVHSTLKELILETYSFYLDNPNRIAIRIFGHSFADVLSLYRDYKDFAECYEKQESCFIYYYMTHNAAHKKREIHSKRIYGGNDSDIDNTDHVIGIGAVFSFPLASAMFSKEDGLHVFTKKGKKEECLVDTLDSNLSDLMTHPLPAGIRPQGTIYEKGIVRKCNFDNNTLYDASLGKTYTLKKNDASRFSLIAPDLLNVILKKDFGLCLLS